MPLFLQIKKRRDLDCQLAFVRPVKLEALERRLRARGTETEESLSRRLARAEEEMEYGLTKGNFDVIITNDSLHAAYADLREFVRPEIAKTA